MLNEQNALISVKDNKKYSDENAIRQAIISEFDAISFYQQIADSTNNKRLRKLMLDIAEEEKVHVGELQHLLNHLDPEHEKSLKVGKREVNKLLSMTEWLDFKQSSV